MMNSIAHSDIQRLMDDIEEVKHVLEMLENDRVSWARNHEERDISNLVDCMNRIEIDMNISMYKYIPSQEQDQENNNHFIEGMRQAFSYVNDLFCDIKNIRKNLNRSYIKPGEFENLKIDWARFSKNIMPLLNSVEEENAL
jgi:hypothetical protein